MLLGVSIHQEDLLSVRSEERRKVSCNCRFSTPAFLIHHRNNHGILVLSKVYYNVITFYYLCIMTCKSRLVNSFLVFMEVDLLELYTSKSMGDWIKGSLTELRVMRLLQRMLLDEVQRKESPYRYQRREWLHMKTGLHGLSEGEAYLDAEFMECLMRRKRQAAHDPLQIPNAESDTILVTRQPFASWPVAVNDLLCREEIYDHL
jgi:hypothetical protein